MRSTFLNPFKFLVLLVCSLMPLLFLGCMGESSTKEISTLKMGLLPDRSNRTCSPEFIQLLKEGTGLEVELVSVKSYKDLVEKFISGEINLALFGALTFMQAHYACDAEPLVMRLIDTEFKSFYISKKGAPTQITDYIGKNLAFGEQLSTSGHLMPRYFLETVWQVDPNLFFSDVSFSADHYATVAKIMDGTADLGAVNSVVFKDIISMDEMSRNQIQVIWETPPYTDFCWAVQATLSQDLKIKIQNIFFGLNTEEHSGILKQFNAKAYIPANIDQFLKLEKIAKDQNLL